MAVLGYLAKLKRDLELAFGAYFQHDFSIKMFLIKYYINGQSFNVTPYFLLLIKENMLFSFRPSMTSLTLSFFCKAMADREKKKGKQKIHKFKYPENEKSFLDEIKNIFRSF